MPATYSLICPTCQHANGVFVTQAGQSVDCAECGATLQAPRLGELKQLPLINAPSSDSAPQRKKRGGLFVAGLLLFLVGGLGGAGVYYYGAQKLVPYDVPLAIEKTSQEIDKLELNDLVALYDELPVEKGLGTWREQPYVGSNNEGEILIKIAYGLIATGGIGGLVLMLVGLLRQ